MGKYSDICIKYEKVLLEQCRELKTSTVDCKVLGQIYINCLDFKQKKEKEKEKQLNKTKINDNQIFIFD